WIGRPGVEGELEDLHPGVSAMVEQRHHLGCDHAQVLCNDRQLPQSGTHDIEEMSPRPLDPFPPDGCPFLCRYLPGRLEAAEVVDAHAVKKGEHLAHAL